jgi:hypothetical protein
MHQIAEFTSGLSFRENFIVKFTPEFQQRAWRGEEYIVWVEGHPQPTDKEIQLFYDDGDESSEEYPDIICCPSDIQSIRKI